MLPYFYKSQIACEYADNVISYRMSSFIHSCTKVSYRWKAFRKSHKYLTGTIKLIQLKMHLRILYYKAIHYLKQHSKISGTEDKSLLLVDGPIAFSLFSNTYFCFKGPLSSGSVQNNVCEFISTYSTVLHSLLQFERLGNVNSACLGLLGRTIFCLTICVVL